MRFITVCDFRYAPIAQRLVLSLTRSGNQSPLTIFCDHEPAFEPLRQLANCELRSLPEIRTLGVKRAKFSVYVQALAEFGDVVYLDSDIIVLEDLSELAPRHQLRACPDDLSACSFIQDRTHPWPGDPTLVNECYVNSGILSIPAELSAFFAELRELSLDDACWQRYIFPGKLYDNHFLCAHLNRKAIPVDLIEAEQYNWQGFIRDGRLQVERRGDRLINQRSGTPLKLVHFAGISEIDRSLCSLPVDVASLLCARSTVWQASPENEFTNFQASLSRQFRERVRDPFVSVVYGQLRSELLRLADGGWQRDFQRNDSYFADADGLLSLVYSRPASDALWNGLRCGGSYLEGDEYNYLAALLRTANIRTAVETGAGETSICLHRAGVRAISIEATPGEWLDRAREAGCAAVHVPFLGARHQFDDDALKNALADMPRDIDLLFIDSPVGTRNRSLILTQLLAILHPRWVLFHDVHRDAGNLYAYQVKHALRMVDYLPSRRGMVLLAAGADSFTPVPRPPDTPTISEGSWSLGVSTAPASATIGSEFAVEVVLQNRSGPVLSSRYLKRVNLSYHWLNRQGRKVVHDGLRTALPFDVYPGDTATFPIRVVAPDQPGSFALQAAIVQEGVRWFDTLERSATCIVEVQSGVMSSAAPTVPGPAVLSRGGPSWDAERVRQEVLASLHIITADMDSDRKFRESYALCQSCTITSQERMYAMWQAVRYVSQQQLEGAVVECGTWLGGNGMLAALALKDLGDEGREIWLYDTFEGMARPTEEDVRHDGQDAVSLWRSHQTGEQSSNWWSAHRETVLDNMRSTGYPADRLRLVKGRVEETIPAQAPEKIAVLRLDTDWYTSTRHEMLHLFPRLVKGGVLIVDDYGWWRGSRQAIDEYLGEHAIHLLLSRIDSSGARLAIKN